MGTYNYDGNNPLAALLNLLNAGQQSSDALAKAQSDLKAAQDQLVALNTQNTKQYQDLQNANATIQSLTNQMTSFQQQLQAMTSDDNSQKAAVASLQQQLQAAQQQLQAQSDYVPAWRRTADKVIAEAQLVDNLGVPYVFGGNNYQGFDCSGMVQQCFRVVGINLPRVSKDQCTQGTEIPYDQAEVGDIVGFDLSANRAGIDHIGIYMGGGKMIHTNTPAEGIHVTDISSGYWHDHIAAIRRIIAR